MSIENRVTGHLSRIRASVIGRSPQFAPRQGHPRPPIAEVLAASTLGQNGLAAEAITEAGWREPYGGRIDLVPSRFDLEHCSLR
jgi:hypothetical protein